jgi:selenocysteine lyase/cysteine desulfurase
MVGVGQALRDANSRAWFLIDACQSVGQINVDVQAIGCDFLSVTGRKFLRGPRGTGFLYSSQRALTELEPFPLDLNAADWTSTGAAGENYQVVANGIRYESWEKSYASVLGLGAAVDYALGLGMPAIETRIGAVANDLREQLAAIPGVTVNDRGTRKGGIVTFMKTGVDAADIVTALRAAKVNCTVSAPDYAMRDFDTYGITKQVRTSPHVYTSPDEIALAAGVVASL